MSNFVPVSPVVGSRRRRLGYGTGPSSPFYFFRAASCLDFVALLRLVTLLELVGVAARASLASDPHAKYTADPSQYPGQPYPPGPLAVLARAGLGAASHPSLHGAPKVGARIAPAR